MSKEDIGYAIGGIVIGLVIGFLIANWTKAGVGAGAATSVSSSTGSKSVNTRPSDLPPGHPDIAGGSQPAGSASSLPAGHPDIGAGGSGPAETAPVELPSLDPLPPGSKEKRVETDHKNIQVLKGIPSDRLEKVMFAFRAALGVDCTHCHIKDQWEKDDKPTKQTARKMIRMTRDANAELGAAGRITCFTCHRGQVRPAQ
ncbi:MAG TPA: c-type cytochrome [Blastocatellia bacterium]|nr:c-type cytochrome [Blastocatellia bacterium]